MTEQQDAGEYTAMWLVDEIEVQASLTRPPGKGPFPAIVMVAGSGPTDRNWNTPLLAGSNGSAALLAQVLADNGFVVLRYDKRASGPDAQANAARLAGRVSMQSHVDELSGGVRLLAARTDVDAGRTVCPQQQRRGHPRSQLPGPAECAALCRADPHGCAGAAGRYACARPTGGAAAGSARRRRAAGGV